MCSGSQLAYSIMLHNNDWIIDIGAISHMCSNKSLLQTLSPLPKLIELLLLDQFIIPACFAGLICLFSHITLSDTLYTPEIKHHLILVNKLATKNNVKVTFLPNSYPLQDLQTNQIIGEGKVVGNLYLFFHTRPMANYVEDLVDSDCVNDEGIVNSECICHDKIVETRTIKDFDLCHNHLGHPCKDVMNHLEWNKGNNYDFSKHVMFVQKLNNLVCLFLIVNIDPSYLLSSYTLIYEDLIRYTLIRVGNTY